MKIFKSSIPFLAALLLWCVPVTAQSIKLTGVVSDENGDPMPGVGVIDKNKPSVGTVTDLDGKYSLSVAADAVLEFSFIGYETVLENVSSRQKIDVRLKPKSSTLDEVVVIGYGTSKKADLTGSVAVVDLDAAQSGTSANITQSLQGRIAGAEFSSQSGAPGESGTIQIRGTRSISAGNEPLIIVDGMMDVVEDLSEINPDDIQSISVLKDVSSTAIYGSRGANGVILISTKPKPQKQVGSFTVRFNAKAGVHIPKGGLDLMNASEFGAFRNASWETRNDWVPGSENHYYADPSTLGVGTDWVKVLSRPAAYQDYYASINGKASNIHYSMSVSYHDEDGIVIGSGFRKITGKASFDVNIKPWMQVGTEVYINNQKTDLTSAAVSGTSSTAAIYLSPLLNQNSTWNWFGENEAAGGAIFDNPYILATNVERWKDRNAFNINPWLKANLGKLFVLDVKFSYNRAHTREFLYSPSSLPVASYNRTGGSATRTSLLKQTLQAEATLNYKQNVGKNALEGVAGVTYQYRASDWGTLTGSGYLDDNIGYDNMRGLMYPDNLNTNNNRTFIQKISFFGRFNWVWNRRYHFSATLRGDGASNFAAGRKWGFFPAFAFRWSIVNESWFRSAYWLNDLSLRLSVGRSGNDAISPYMSLATLQSQRTAWNFGESRSVAYTPVKLANSQLSWETTDALNVGLNFEAFQSRLGIEVDGYVSVTRDLLLSMRNSQVTGYETYFSNVGRVRNAGVEVTINTKNIISRDFKWNTTLTIAHNRQMVVEAGEGNSVVPTYLNPRNSSQYLYGYKKGYPVNALWGYRYEGVWKSLEEYERNKATHLYVSSSPVTTFKAVRGYSKFADLNHNGVLDEGDMEYLGCSDAVVYGGFQNDFILFKRLKIGIYFAYSIGGQIYNLSELYLGSGNQSYNKYRYMINAYSPDNPDSNLPAAYRDDALGCSRFVHDASFLRLKTVSIDYDVPLSKKVTKVLKGLKLGVSADNIWLLKSYNGFDPDVNTSSTVYRLDNGSYPRPCTIIGKIFFRF